MEEQKEFKDESLISNFIPDGNSILDRINMDKRVKQASGRVLIEGMVSSTTSSGGVNIIGINHEQESEVTTISNYIKDGTFFESKKRNPIVVGKKLADKLGLEEPLHKEIAGEDFVDRDLGLQERDCDH